MNWRKFIFLTLTLLLFGFLFYTACFGKLSSQIQLPLPFALASVLIIITNPITKRDDIIGKMLRILDYVLIFLIIGAIIYLIWNYEFISENVGLETPAIITTGIVGTLIALEICRRSVGWSLTLVVLFFLGYDYFGYLIPGTLGHAGISVDRIVRLTFLSAGDGVFGVAFGVMVSVIFYFTVLGGVLNAIGASKFFIDLAMAIVGQFRSGPALSAVVASCFMGMISGSAPANVVTTGVVTIPLMKSRGYSPTFAGAVEATASSGGQIMPPIMGAGAFIMAEILGVPYLQVCLWAAIPAILYFVCCGVSVHLESVRLGLKGLEAGQKESFLIVLRRGWYFMTPIAVLIILMAFDLSLSRCAFWSLVTSVMIGLLLRSVRNQPMNLVKGIIDGVEQSLPIFAACAAVGISIVSVTMAGLGTKLSIAIALFSGQNLLFSLILTMITSLILGMGLPTVAAYLMLATIMAPTLVQLGLQPPVAHLFIFYFAVISAITPPVALAAYAGAAIAGADPMRVGLTAVRLGLVAFIIPFMFAYYPALLLIGAMGDIFRAVLTALIGFSSLAMALAGFSLRRLSLFERFILGVASILLIHPGLITDLLGVFLFLFILAWQTGATSRIFGRGKFRKDKFRPE